MDTEERDRTDQGLINEISPEEWRELREHSRRRDTVPAPRSAATTEMLVREFGWRPRGEVLAKPCPRCEAPALTWCRSGKRVIVGKLCEARALGH